MKRKIILTFLVYLIVPVFACGQIVEFSKQLNPTTIGIDSNIIVLSDMWEKYLMNELQQNTAWAGKDYMEYITPDTRYYKYSLHRVFNISKCEMDLYEINTISYMLVNPEDYYELVSDIFRVYAKRIGGQWKFINSLDLNMKNYKQYVTKNLRYIFPYNYKFSKKDAAKAENFIREFCELYNIKPRESIVYIVSNSLNQSSRMIGIDYTLYRSSNKYAGRMLYPSTILSSRVNHIHEIVHALVMDKFPHCPYILNEGIATYYGGHANVTYIELYNIARKWLESNKIDFMDLDLNRVYLDNLHPLSNILGARIIEFFLQNKGPEYVSYLLNKKPDSLLNEILDIDKANINDFIYINLFDIQQ